MIDRNSKWDRQELYEKVWQFPIRKLAAEYGISDVGLAKVCRKLEIPLPGLGHWTRIACGHAIPRPPLPEVENLPTLYRQVREEKTSILPEDEPKLEAIERVATALTPPLTKGMLAHPLIEKTKVAFSAGGTTTRGTLWASREVERLDVRVTKDCLARALRILATLIHMLTLEGFKVVVEKKIPESTSTIVYGENIRFGVIERSRQIKPAKPNGSSSYSYDSIRLKPTGILSIEVWNYYSGGPQKVWRDREKMKLEEQLPKCIAGMMRIALWERAERDKHEKEEQARQKRIDEVRAELQKIEKEEKKIKVLEREAIRWHRAERLRSYVAAVRASAAKDAEWLAWAERQVDSIDPLKPTPPSIMDDKGKVIRRLHSVEGYWWAGSTPEEDSEDHASSET